MPINYCVIEVNHGQTVTYEVLVNKVILIFYLAFCLLLLLVERISREYPLQLSEK